MFATLAYNAAAAGVNTVNLDFNAVTDPEFSQRNNHYIFTEDYKLLATMAVGASLTRGRYQVPKWNAVGEFIIFNVNRALQPTSNPQYDPYFPTGLAVPKYEEFQVQMSNNLGAATEQENVLLFLGTTDWNRNQMPSSMDPPFICIRTSVTVTPTINTWAGLSSLTFSQNLKGGVYSVAGAVCQGTNSAAFRLVFPRIKLYHGRKLRPGGPVQTAIGDVVSNQFDPWIFYFGEWGQFHTFEPPQVEFLGTTASSTTYQIFLWLKWLGENAPLYGQPYMAAGA